jgi:hypothetical protein
MGLLAFSSKRSAEVPSDEATMMITVEERQTLERSGVL